MNPMHLIPGAPRITLRWIDEWSVASQQRARRNAMIASTALAQRRAELDDVEEFLAGLDAPSLVVGQVAAHG
jgi:hypothetical protein